LHFSTEVYINCSEPLKIVHGKLKFEETDY